MRRWASPHHGRLMTPRMYCRAVDTAKSGLPWAADSDGFGGVDPEAYRRMVVALAFLPGCRFLVAPDVFSDARDGADHEATLRAWREWHPWLSLVGLPLAFVLQNGSERGGVPWDECDAVFVGGDTEWKLGPHAEGLVREAKARGKWAHMGRVNSVKRIRYAGSIGCDSVDGSGFAKYRDAMMPKGLRAAGEGVQLRMEIQA